MPPTRPAHVLLAIVKRARGANNRYSRGISFFEIRICCRDNALLCCLDRVVCASQGSPNFNKEASKVAREFAVSSDFSIFSLSLLSLFSERYASRDIYCGVIDLTYLSSALTLPSKVDLHERPDVKFSSFGKSSTSDLPTGTSRCDRCYRYFQLSPKYTKMCIYPLRSKVLTRLSLRNFAFCFTK